MGTHVDRNWLSIQDIVRREGLGTEIATSLSLVLGDFDGDVSPPSRDSVTLEIVLTSSDASRVEESSPGSVVGVELRERRGRKGKVSSIQSTFVLPSRLSLALLPARELERKHPCQLCELMYNRVHSRNL